MTSPLGLKYSDGRILVVRMRKPSVYRYNIIRAAWRTEPSSVHTIWTEEGGGEETHLQGRGDAARKEEEEGRKLLRERQSHSEKRNWASECLRYYYW